ncbi:Rib/alpha-like domain-containing protein [Gardnerella swidsinskii]|uniref:Rib/alpha-like domain-containing protein n=1 Tax=Gardnerella swidsinskii TaxID=2792979 RepID=UPI000E2E929C|nr:Rib/alpha-like domain-containing protein [Gardnerella swidsinskii]
MLPAKFRGFASRVGRLASRALVWHKTSERDAAVRTSSTTVISSSNASTFGTASTSFDKAVISDSAANSDNVTTIARTAHPAHTLRRALFAMFVAAATIVTMLIVPPMKEANATNVSWDYIGNGYISPNSLASYDVYRDFDVQSPDINTVTVNGKKKTTITWNVLFNANGCRIKKIENPNVDCDENTALHAYDGRPDFYLILPKNIKDNSIRITRYRTKFAGYSGRGKRFVWEERGKDQIPSDFNGYTNATRLPGDSDYENFWKASIEKCGLGTDATCEVDTWRRAGNFGRLFKSWEQDNAVDSIRWIVTAEVEEGSDPYKLPFMAGWISYYGDKHKFTVFGPYDHDGDGIPDLEEFKYGLNPKNDDDIQFPKRSKEDAVYGEVTSVKPYINTGEWVGDSYNGDFKYYKDMPNHGGRTTSEMIPTDAGIEFTFKKNEIGNSEILPPGVTKTNNPNNMQPGQAYINPKTGEVKYSPKASDRNKTIHFEVQINYPDPKPNNCKMNNSIVKVKGVDIHVVSQASRYNPYYDDTTVKAGEEKNSPNPKDRGGKKFPSGTKFKAEIYNKYQNPPTWAKINNESTGVVTFHPNKWVPASKTGQPEKRPVVVHYPDGSTSKDKDSGNHGDPVNAPVYVTRDNPGTGDLQLHIHKNQNGQEIDYNDGFVFRKNREVKPQPWIDSWSVQEPGDITIRSVCADTTNPLNLKFYLNGINGITINGEKPWPHATDEEQEKCRNGQGCAANKLFDSTGRTMERTRGSITGKPLKVGNYQCTVYALKPKALKKFEDAAKKNKDIEKQTGSPTNIINPDTFKGLREDIDYTSRTVPIKVHSDAHYYNPQYDKVYVQAGGKSKESAAPVSHSGANGVKGNDKSQQELVQNGTRLPKGTWFELRTYPKDNEHVLTWYKFVNKQSNKKSGKDEPEDSTTDARYGKVTFSPEKTVMLGEYFAPVIVHYPDGSTSEDPDSGNLGKPVYAPVEVTSQPIQKNDLKLNVYSQYGGRRIENNDKNGMRFRKDEVLGDATGNTKPMFFDSWSSAKQGKIYQRMLCYKKNPQTGKPESYEIDGINGLTLAGRKGNTTSGEFIDKQPSQWTRATEKNKYECTVHGKNCNRNLYLYGDEHDTVERTWGWLHGKVKENGDFVCTVYAIKDLENKDGKHGDLQNKFDKAVNDFVKKPADRKFEEVIKSVLTDKPGSEDSPQEATQRHIDWDSVTFPIHVHSDAHYYNPEYKTISMEAGTKQATEVPKSKKNANDANTLQDDVREGDLPDGTWFKFKKSLSYTFFEDDQDNKADSGDSAKNGTGQFGKVTFRPHKWFPVGSDKVQVIVHYPDGSTSEDKDSGNLGKPIYAKVDITRSHDEDAGNLRLNVGDREGSGDWNDTTIKLTKGEELSTSKKTTRWLDSWSKYKPGKINLRTICNKINSDGTKSHYQSGGIAGIKMQDVKIWNHTEDASAQKACEKDASQCHPDRQLYDDYIANGNSKDTTERTRGWIKGKANESGDYKCVVYAIKAKQFSKDNNDLLTRFDAAVGALNKDASKNNTDPLKDFKWKLDGNNGNKNAVKGVDYEYRSIPIHIHNDNHFYNPKYVDVSVTAGQKVENAVPQSVKSANGADKYQDVVKAGALPDGTWFEFKDATNGFEVNADGTAGNKVSLDWSYWASNNAADKTGEQSNKPDNPSKQKNGKHSSKDDGTRYGKVTFHPDQSVAPKAYLKEIVIHYPDGSTSDDSDSGNNGKPVYAKVTVGGLSGADKDLKMTLLRSQDADPVHDTLGSGNSLTVMSGTSLTKNPYVLAWSLKDRSNISLRMMCAKQGEQKWSRGLDDTLNMHLNQNYGESVKPWAFATADQRKSCSQDSKNCMANLLYGFTKDKDPNSIESAVSRSEDDIAGVPQKAGNYTCAVFALKPNALTVFNNTVNGSLIEGNKYSSTNMQTTQLAGVTVGKDWNRIAVNVTVIDPPKFALPKTGGMNWNVLLGTFAVIGTGVMAAGFFLEQTKWGRAMLEALLRKTLIKDFICKTAKKLRALRRRSERWRC